LTLADWKQLRGEVAKLHDGLTQIDLAWAEDDRDDPNATSTTTVPNNDAGSGGEAAIQDNSENSDQPALI
jgi:hypothetical protein